MPGSATRRPDKSGKLTPAQLRRKIALLQQGLSIADVAREAKVSRQTAWEVVMGRSRSNKVEATFARLVGAPAEKFFPPRAA